MKIRLGDLRRLIREAVEPRGLALYRWSDDASRMKVVLYSPEDVLGLDWSDRWELPKEVLRGYAAFHETDNPCNGAWEVSSIAGIGYGKLLYGLGYYLVPSHRLMPDRMYSSKRAKDAWGKQVGKSKSYPLDDVNSPQTPDPTDDCDLRVPMKKGGPDPVLDAAYEGVGVDPGPMVSVHDGVVEELMKILNDLGGDYSSVEDVDKMFGDMLKKASTKFFTSEFEKYYKER